jgi:ABC-type multidrug transport system fused ATPase/permease subunit
MLDAVVKGITPVVTLLLIQRLIDLIQYQSGTWKDAVCLLVWLSAVQIASELVLIFTNVKLTNYELDFERYFQKKIFSKVSSLGSKDFESSHTYDLINRTQYGANIGMLGSIKTFFSLSSALISSISYAIIIIKYNIVLFAIIMAVPLIRYLFEKKYNLKEYAVEKENTEPNRRIGYISYLLTDSENFKEIKTFGLFDFFINRFQDIKGLCNLKLIRLNIKRGRAFSVLTILEKAVDLGVTLLILSQTFVGVLSIGKFILYNNSIDSLKSNVVSMFSQLSYLYKNSAMLDQIRIFFDLEPERINEDGIEIDNIQTIRLDKVSYKYQGKQDYALKNITLDLNAGELAIFMGNNGSGKTTLVKIIMGIYNDYTGTVLINGFDLRNLNLDHYRQKVSTLFQNYINYESSIEENISYGNVRERSDKERVKDILDKVQLQEYKEHLSQILGYQFQDGTQMSIGQWQKLALGRALYRDADVYIFDEPNASLDLKTESSILQTIHNETLNKITLIIMHRFNYLVKYANKIVVLKDGSIVEMGTHDQLIKGNGIYYELFCMHKKVDESESDR